MKAGIASDREALATAVKETLRYGLFLGSFAGTFVCVDECIAALGGHDRYFIFSFLESSSYSCFFSQTEFVNCASVALSYCFDALLS